MWDLTVEIFQTPRTHLGRSSLGTVDNPKEGCHQCHECYRLTVFTMLKSIAATRCPWDNDTLRCVGPVIGVQMTCLSTNGILPHVHVQNPAHVPDNLKIGRRVLLSHSPDFSCWKHIYVRPCKTCELVPEFWRHCLTTKPCYFSCRGENEPNYCYSIAKQASA